MKWVFHGFNLFSVVILGGFAFFAAGLAMASLNYRRWRHRDEIEHR